MNSFAIVWVMLVVCALDVAGRLVNIYRGDLTPKRTEREYIGDLVINTVLATWCVCVLIWGKA